MEIKFKKLNRHSPVVLRLTISWYGPIFLFSWLYIWMWWKISQTWLANSSKKNLITCLKTVWLNQLLGLLSHIFHRQPGGGLGGLIFKIMAVKIKLCAASIIKIVKLPASWHCWWCSHPHRDPVSLQNIRARTLQGTGFNLSFGRLPGSLCNKYMLVDGDKVVYGSYRWGALPYVMFH